MKKKNWLCVAMCLLQVALINAAPKDADISIIGSVSTGEAPIPATKALEPAFDIKNTKHLSLKGRSITIHEVEPPPTHAGRATLRNSHPEPQTSTPPALEEGKVISTSVLFVSGIVYGQPETRFAKLRIWCDGNECEIVTNIDFRHFSGFGGFRVEDRAYMCLPSVVSASESDVRNVESVSEGLRNLSKLSKSGIANRYIVLNKHTETVFPTQVLDDMITLYEQEKNRLAAAYEARRANDKIRAARRAAAGPKPPKPVTIHFWKRDVEKEQAQARQQQAAQKGEAK